MGITLIIAGIVFLLNPAIRMIDLMPDLIGCLLMLLGLSRLYVLDDRIENARRMCIYFALVSALKIPASLYIPIRAKTYLLPATFLFSVLEIILMVSLFTSLLGGLSYLASRDGVLKGHGARSESASVAAFIFAILRGVLSFAPELLSLGEQKDNFDYTFRPTPAQNAALIKPYAEVLCLVLVIILGIYTGVHLIKYLVYLRRDKEFCRALRERFLQYEADNFVTVTQRKTKAAFIVLFLALVTLINPIVDSVNILPNTIFYALLSLSLYLLTKATKSRAFVKIIPLCVATVPISVINNITQYRLLSETQIDIMGMSMTIRKIPELLSSLDFLSSGVMLIAVEYILLAVIFLLVIRSIVNLEILRDNDTIGIFEIMLFIFSVIYFASCVGVYLFPHIRTAFSGMTRDINQYIKYDTYSSICEWTSYGSFVIMLYLAYKLGVDVLSRIKEVGSK